MPLLATRGSLMRHSQRVMRTVNLPFGEAVVLATKTIQPGAHLLRRYGHDYWFKRIDYNPYDLSLTLYRKYATTMKEFERKDWQRALKRKAKGLKQTSPKKTTISEATGNNRTTELVQVCNNIKF